MPTRASRTRSWGFVALLAANLAAQDATTPVSLHARVQELYGFAPHTLDAKRIEAKSEELDRFWEMVKKDPITYLPQLRTELADPGTPTFFAFDGSKLLMSLSKEPADLQRALDAIPRADLQDINHLDYLKTVLWLAGKGLDSTRAGLRILDYPAFEAVVPQHSLTLGQDYALIYLLLIQEDSRFLSPLTRRLQTELDPTSQKSILLALWYTCTPEGQAAITNFAGDASKAEVPRSYARDLLKRTTPGFKPPSPKSIAKLKARRRELLRVLSDEALIEFDQLTLKMYQRP